MSDFPDDLSCLVISLRRSTERRATITKMLADRDYHFEFVDAIDAKYDLTPELMARVDLIAMRERTRRDDISLGEIACALSHSSAYRKFLDSNKAYALILEDDAIPTCSLDHVIQTGGFRAVPMLMCFHGNAWVDRSGNGIDLGQGILARRLTMNSWGAVGYFINRKVAKKLADATQTITFMSDWPLDLVSLRAYACVPQIVLHPPLRDQSQSLLEAGRSKPKKIRKLSDYFTKGYLRRKWTKYRGEKIS